MTPEQFETFVRNHRLTVIRAEGAYRHLHVAIPGTELESWHIHTWPGYLAMVGDMGDWVFQRLPDMLDFFRGDRPNPTYWAEKLVATKDGWTEFSCEAFYDAVKEAAINACDVDSWDEVPEERQEDLETLLDASDEYEAVARIRDWSEDWLDLTDFWDGQFVGRKARPSFLFACLAIQHTVKLWDARGGLLRRLGL